jgi:hypothetical protein
MIALILLIIGAVGFGLLGVYGCLPPRSDWPRGVASLLWAVTLAALAFWHQGH